MSEFRGLHNPERHKGNQPDTRCVRCHGGYEVCAPDAPCYCCLAAEVQALREQVQRVRELHHFVVDEIETREGPEDVQHCAECGYIPTDEEPCPTIRILDGAA